MAQFHWILCIGCGLETMEKSCAGVLKVAWVSNGRNRADFDPLKVGQMMHIPSDHPATLIDLDGKVLLFGTVRKSVPH